MASHVVSGLTDRSSAVCDRGLTKPRAHELIVWCNSACGEDDCNKQWGKAKAKKNNDGQGKSGQTFYGRAERTWGLRGHSV